jgi:dephospho-CoA kinase/phosphopantetheine adenylyltransferase
MYNKSIVFTFGRFNPPTTGHALLINKVVDVAASLGAENRIYASLSHDPEKNPLPHSEKVAFIKQLFPKANISTNKNAGAIHQIMPQLVKEGFKHVTFIVGSDRVPEFTELFTKYIKNKKEKGFDPKKHYDFDSFKVISAGERDPDAIDVTGISGSKMREFVRSNDFNSFMRYIPTKNVSLGRKIFAAVKRYLTPSGGKKLNESILMEGCNDQAIFKAVFLAGGPGSGKDFIAKQVLYGYGLVEINSDKAFEYNLKKEHMDLRMPESELSKRNSIRARSKYTTYTKELLALKGRLGLIINGTADDYLDVKSKKEMLEAMGYETRMLYVMANNEVSSARNKMRGLLGGREIPEEIRSAKYKKSLANVKDFETLFGPNNFDLYNNNLDLQIAPLKEKEEENKKLLGLFKKIRAWADKKPTNAICQRWLSSGHLNEMYRLLGIETINETQKDL